jgi:hypothetical protein
MRNYNGKLVGILGTVIIHLIAGIIFMSFKISTLNKDFTEEFMVEITPVDEPEISEKLIELPVTSVEKILQGDEEMLNIVRNLANKSDVKIDPNDYIDKVKEELIQSGKLGLDNYIDEQKRLNEMNAEEKLAYENNTAEDSESDKPKESQEMAANYKGPTRIYYDLEGRNHMYLPIPIYKCQGSGKIVLSIEVNQKGIVEGARVIANESTTSDLCLVETAVNSALISRFNQDINSPKIQTGTLTYHFVAQ